MRLPRFHFLKQERILGGAIVLAITQFGASLVGLIRDNLLSRTFPGLDTVDVYLSSFRPSDLLFQVTIMAAFSVALVPLLAQYHAHKNEKEMSHLLSGSIAVASLFFGIVALIVGIFFRQIAPLMTQFTGENLDLYIQFGRIALLTNFLFVSGNAFGQYLITIQRYWWYGLTPILYTLGTIFGTVFLTPYYGEYGPILGTLFGAIVYVLLRFMAVLRAGYRPHLSFWHPDISEMGLLMIPKMLALGALQFEFLLFDRVASGLESGSITINAFARNFQSVVVGVVGIALAQSVFSLLSQSAAHKDGTRFWLYIKKGTAMMLLLTIPGALVLVIATPIAARLVHLTDVLPIFGMTLALYAISIPFESLNHLLQRALYSLKSSISPSILNVVNAVTAIAVAWILVPRFGVYSLAIGFTAGQIVQMIGMSLVLRSKKF